MALTITSSSYNGEHAGQYVSAALRSAKSLDFVTILDNVNHKRVVNKVAGSHLVKDSTCAFNETADGSNTSTLTLTESVLFVEPFQINIDVCKTTMLADWSHKFEGDFMAYAMTYLADSIADSVEHSIWQGATSTNGQFDSVSETGMATSSKTGTFSASNIIANLQKIVADMPTNVYGKEDLYIYMNKKTYRFYISAISALSAFPFNHMGEYTPEFEGIKIAVCPGVADNVMYAGQKSNIFFGTSLQSDLTAVKALDMENLDGSNNVRMVAKWTAGVQVGVASDWVYMS